MTEDGDFLITEDKFPKMFEAARKRVDKLRAETSSPSDSDMVNHPPHYQGHPKGIEAIDVIEDFNSPNLANVVKYAWRVDFGGKWDDLEDLDKLIWYAQRERQRRDTVRLHSGH